MQKKITKAAIIVLMSLSLNGFAQLETVRNFYIGLSFSPMYTFNSSNYYSTVPNFTSRSGIDMKFRITKQLALSTGIFVQNFRSKETHIGSGYSNKTTYNSYILQIPVRLDVRLTRKKIAPFLTAGILADLYQYNTFSVTSNFPTNMYTHKGSAGDTYIHPVSQIGFGIDITTKHFKFQAYPLYDVTFSKDYGSFEFTHALGLVLSACVKI